MGAKSRFDSYLFVLLVSVILLLPLWTKSSYVISVMVFVAIFGVLTLGMGVLLEQAGLFSLAHPSWFALGAYAAGILAVRGIMPPWAAMLAGALGVGVLSYLMGLGLLRLKGYYLACATFALLLIVVIVLGQLGSLTGGHEGLMGVPPLSIGGFVFQRDIHYYYLGWALCLGCLLVLSNIMNGRVGRAIKAFRDSEVAAKSLGVNVLKYKLQIFVLTAVMASLNGSIFCFYLRFTNPEMYSFPLLIELITMLVVGGGMKVHGPLLGCFVTVWLRELIHPYLGDILPVLTAEVDAIFFGAIIVVILIFMPGGLTGWLEEALRYGRKAVGQT
jgi:branched-chain amino acid transport system permease protein